MAKRFSQRILDFLRQSDYQPTKARRLAEAMGVPQRDFEEFFGAVDSLRKVGRVVLNSANAVALPHSPNQIAGTFRGNARGFGFVVPDDPQEHGDLFIAPGETLDAVTGDKVLCTVVRKSRSPADKSFGGRVIKIIERGNSKFVGELVQDGSITYVKPDGNAFHTPIIVSDAGAKGARPGDQVVVEVVTYPTEGRPAKGVIVERLGAQGGAGVDLLTIIRQFHLSTEFPAEALEEVRAAAKAFAPEKELGRREDLSGVLTITIDPDDAKDYDDAISLERLNSAQSSKKRPGMHDRAAWELGVHIADVSAFVTPGGALDEEARKRGTSVYFPGYVVPMLPEILSNGLCSLQEGEYRLCKSAFIRYDAEGRPLESRFANSVIRSTKRLTYGQATAILQGDRSHAPAPVIDLVLRMDTLARAIQKRRIDQGMISLDLPEVRLILDRDGRAIDAEPEDTSYSHTIIEMCMVEANEAVARQLDRLGTPFIRRIHPEPSPESLESVGMFLRAAGFSVPKKLTPGDLQMLLAPLKGKPESYAVNLAVLKSMETAEYSPRQVGHFALASKCYTHFTSPIRRYSDLMIHRLLDLYIRGEIKDKYLGGRDDVPDKDELTQVARDLSYLSRRAESAESELKTLKVLQLLAKDHVGEEFEGVVTGITNFGLFVQHPKYLIDGLLRLEDLGDDHWTADVRSGRVVGQRTRQSFMMSSVLAVRIAEIDIAARQMRLAPAGHKGALSKPRAGRGAGSRGGDSRGGAERSAREKPKGRRGRTEGRRTKSFKKRRGR